MVTIVLDRVPGVLAIIIRSYHDCKLTLLNPTRARLQHRDGSRSIPAGDLPESLQTALGFDPDEAEEHAISEHLAALKLILENVKSNGEEFTYFFRFENHHREPWSQPLTLQLIAQAGHPIPGAHESIIITKGIPKGSFARVSITSRLGSPSTHGEYGATKVSLTLGRLDQPKKMAKKPFRIKDLK